MGVLAGLSWYGLSWYVPVLGTVSPGIVGALGAPMAVVGMIRRRRRR